MSHSIIEGSWGPNNDSQALYAEVDQAGGDLSNLGQIEELFRYDGTLIDLMNGSNGTKWLRYIYDEGKRPDPGIRNFMSTATHYLLLPDIEAARSTLHDDNLPTVETYRLATAIIRESSSYILDNRVSSEHTLKREIISFEQAMDDSAIYPQLRPGKAMLFGPFEDAFAPFAGDDRHLYRYPVPSDRVLATFDCDRNWIGRFDDGPDEFHLIVCVKDDESGYIQHRLTFHNKLERAVLDTLAAAQAPTMDTYRLAHEITQETILETKDGPTITVIPISIDDPEFIRPSYENVAAHDAEWPQYARRA